MNAVGFFFSLSLPIPITSDHTSGRRHISCAPLSHTFCYCTRPPIGFEGPPAPSLEAFTQTEDLSDVRIGVYDAWFEDSSESVRTRCREILEMLKSRGATLVDVTIPHLQSLRLAHAIKIGYHL